MAEVSLLDKKAILENMSPVLALRNIKYPLGSLSHQGKKAPFSRKKQVCPGKHPSIAGALHGTTFPEVCLGLLKRTPPFKGLPKFSDLQALMASKKGGFGKGGAF